MLGWKVLRIPFHPGRASPATLAWGCRHGGASCAAGPLLLLLSGWGLRLHGAWAGPPAGTLAAAWWGCRSGFRDGLERTAPGAS